MVAKEKMTIPQRIQSSIDDMDMFIRTCNGQEFAEEIDFLATYLEDAYKNDKIASETYLMHKGSIKERIRAFGGNCECNIKGGRSRISYVGPS